MNGFDEKVLAVRAAGGDAKAFGELVKAAENKLFWRLSESFLRRVCYFWLHIRYYSPDFVVWLQPVIDQRIQP